MVIEYHPSIRAKRKMVEASTSKKPAAGLTATDMQMPAPSMGSKRGRYGEEKSADPNAGYGVNVITQGGAQDRLDPSRKPARRQVDFALPEEERTDLSSMGLDSSSLKSLRSTYGGEKNGGLAHLELAPQHRRRSMTRCVPSRDAGLTDGAREGTLMFCLDFARGRCPDGSACTHRHDVPTIGDDVECLSSEYDIFGRKRSLLLTAWERHHGKKEEGANELKNAALHVSGLRPPARKRTAMCGGLNSKSRSINGELDVQVRKCFGNFGEVLETQCKLDNVKASWAVITYASRCAAEFAKEAMTGQGLSAESPEILQVRYASAKGDYAKAVTDDGYTRTPNFKPVITPVEKAAASVQEALPEGWTTARDASGMTYYCFAGRSQWEPPTLSGFASNVGDSADVANDLPDGWARLQDPTSSQGRVYYHNAKTNKTQWERPTIV